MTSINLPALISTDELEQKAPELYALYRDAASRKEDEDEDGEYDDTETKNRNFIYFESDARLSEKQYDSIKSAYGYYTPIAVNGSLHVEGRFSTEAVIYGDLHCDTLYSGEGLTEVRGTVFARYHAVFMAEDHEALCYASPFRLNTPYVFSWFYDLSAVQLPADTIIFILCDYSAYKNMDITHPHFFWHDDIYALTQDCFYRVGSHYSDAAYWNLDAIAKAQQTGQSFFINGFDINCQPLCQKAAEHVGLKQYAEAFILYQQAIELSSNYYIAWLKAGEMLFNVGAYEQAIPYLEKASGLFPQKQKDLNNRAADMAALCYVRLRRLEEAIRWASFSIESSVNNLDDKNLYFAYRIRGEAFLLQNAWDEACTDLEIAVKKAWDNATANWLMGLVYHHMGNNKKAKQHHDVAEKILAKFAAGYDAHRNTDFAYLPPVTVDW